MNRLTLRFGVLNILKTNIYMNSLELWIVDLNTASVKSIGGANGRVLESFVFNNYAFFVGTTPQVTSFNLKTFERRTFKYEVLEGIQVTSCHLDDQQEYLYIVTEKSIIQFDLKQLEFMNHYLTPVGLTSASIFNQGFGLVSGGEQSLVIFSVPKRDISPGMNRLVVPLVVSGISVLLFLVALVILCCLIQARSVYKKRRALQSMKYQLLDLPSSEYNNIINSNGTYGSDKWILNIEDIKFKERINEGAGGIVFKAEWKNIRVAVKKMKRDHLDVDHASFIREAQLLIQLRHTNIVLFLGVCVSDDHTLIVTEFLDNGSLDGYLNGQFKLLSFREKLLILCQVVQAMIYLHSLKPSLIHRDLKPQNILLDRHMQAKICDFGLSKFDEGRGSMTGYIGTLNVSETYLFNTLMYVSILSINYTHMLTFSIWHLKYWVGMTSIQPVVMFIHLPWSCIKFYSKQYHSLLKIPIHICWL